MSETDLAGEVRAAAFHLLLETGKPVGADALSAELGSPAAEVAAAIEQLESQGVIRRDLRGAIVGSYGLSVVPSQDEIQVEGRQFWTWCAKTSLGVLGAIGAGGTVVAHCPVSGRQIVLNFRGAEPPAGTDFAVFWPSTEFTSCCKKTVDEVCPNINFFENQATAEAWAAKSGVPGEILSVEEATRRSVGRWADLFTARNRHVA